MDQLPLSRDSDGQVHLEDTGPVKICVNYDDVLGSGGQGTVCRAKVFDASGTRLLMEVRVGVQVQLSINSCAETGPSVGPWAPWPY